MTIQFQNPISIQVMPGVTVTTPAVSYRADDDTESKILVLRFKHLAGQPSLLENFPLVIKDPDYTTLGEWTDASLKAYVLQRLGVATNA